MKFEILNRWDKSVVFTAEIECNENEEYSLKLGLAVKIAVNARANLSRANLYGANLDGANLYGANLDGANLSRANLYGANLSRANLYGANLDGANLYGANLSRANLYGANLYGANLYGANLDGANLDGANYGEGVPLTRQPIQISWDNYNVVILDCHMKIGCQLHKLADWASFDDRRIGDMDGTAALRFWKKYKDVLLSLAKADGRE